MTDEFLYQNVKSITNAWLEGEQNRDGNNYSKLMLERPYLRVVEDTLFTTYGLSIHIPHHKDYQAGSKGGWDLVRQVYLPYGILLDWLDEHGYECYNLTWTNFDKFWLVCFEIKVLN